MILTLDVKNVIIKHVILLLVFNPAMCQQ